VLRTDKTDAPLQPYLNEINDIGRHGCEQAILEAGGGHILMIGSPRTGKTMLAQRLPTIFPPLTPAESLETSRIYSATGRLPAGEALLIIRPFCTLHQTISDAGMVGGGNPLRPMRFLWPIMACNVGQFRFLNLRQM
jgi:magnesium chelatase family protein